MKSTSSFPKVPALLEPDCLVSYLGHSLEVGGAYSSAVMKLVPTGQFNDRSSFFRLLELLLIVVVVVWFG